MLAYLYPVKRRIAILLVGIYLFSFSELSQFLKLPVLVQHFVEHQTQDSSITFWAFIKEHYNGKFEIDDDYHRDSQLPFRTTDCAAYNIVVLSDAPVTPDFLHHSISFTRNFVLRNDEQIYSAATSDIFQPPRSNPL